MTYSSGHRGGYLRIAPAGALLAFLISLVAGISGAVAEVNVCTPGSGTGQCSGAAGVAVDPVDALLFVADGSNSRVDVFNAESGAFLRAFGWGVLNGASELQTCTASCQTGIAGAGAGQFSGPIGIAVDRDAGSSAFHDIYVYDGSNSRVQRFHPSGEFVSSFGSSGSGEGQFESIKGIGVGASGAVYVIDVKSAGSCEIPGVEGNKFTKRVQKFTPEGSLIEAPILLTDAPCGQVQAFAVDSGGDFYVGNAGGSGAVRKYQPTGIPVGSPFPINVSFNIQSLATDSANNVFVGDRTPAGLGDIAEYDANGAEQRVVYGSTEHVAAALAPYSSAGGDIFVVDNPEGVRKVIQIGFELAGPVILPFDGLSLAGRAPYPSGISNTKATLNAEINPEGKATKYHFEYVDEETCEEDVAIEGEGHCFDHAKRTPVEASEDPSVGSDFLLHKVTRGIGCPDPLNEAEEPESKCLAPETVYRWRVSASNSDGAGNSSIEGESFETGPSLVVGEAWSTAVGTVDARLHGEVNPQGIPATGWFEYVDDATYREDVEVEGASHGFDHATEVPDSATPIDFGGGEGMVPAAVQLGALITGTIYHYRLAAQNPLIEPRFSLEHTFTTFSPPSGSKPPCANDQFRTGASASLADCRAYELVTPLDKNGGDIVTLLDSSLEQATPDAQRLTYSSYRSFADPESAPFTSQYLAHRDQKNGWESESIATPREGPSFFGLKYRVVNQYKLFSEDLCSAWVATEAEPQLDPAALSGFPNLYRRDNCATGGASYEALTTTVPTEPDPENFDPKPQAFSADGSLSVFTAEGQLSPDGVFCDKSESEFCTRQLYAFHEGDEVPRLVCYLPDGSPNEHACAAGFIRNPLGTVGQREDNAYHAVSDDGSRVFWTDLPESAKGKGPIYVRINPDQEGGNCGEMACTLTISATDAHFRTAAADGSMVIYTKGESEGALHEVNVDKLLAEEAGADAQIAGEALNVLGASEDASRVYFVSHEVLTGEEENSNGDKAKAGQFNLYLHDTGAGSGSFAFIGMLSPGDSGANVDDSPLLRTSRVSPDGSHLAFVSEAQLTSYDNKDAASGKADKEVYLYDAGAEELRCVSCNPSGARPAGRDLNAGGVPNWTAARIPAWLNGTHFSQILSDDGSRLFFESVDQLVLRDTNSSIDVYEWGLAGSQKACDEAGADIYSEEAGGCISLISSGKSKSDSELVDASTDGSDVFIKTDASLLPPDPGLIDIYDAKVGGGFPEPTPPVPCEGEACQSPPPPPVELTPSSSVFKGDGNSNEESVPKKPRCPKSKREVRKAGKVRCVKKQKQHKHKRHQRANPQGKAGR
jgi:DNA-binding beta-propeller fold protein YncE